MKQRHHYPINSEHYRSSQ